MGSAIQKLIVFALNWSKTAIEELDMDMYVQGMNVGSLVFAEPLTGSIRGDTILISHFPGRALSVCFYLFPLFFLI